MQTGMPMSQLLRVFGSERGAAMIRAAGFDSVDYSEPINCYEPYAGVYTLPDKQFDAYFLPDRDAFRKASLPLMKFTNILSFNTRSFVLFFSILIRMPWIYFAFELTVMNGLMIYMMARHERICRKFENELKN